MPTEKWQSALNTAASCEIFWSSADGRLQGIAGTPLLWEDQPTLAFPYAHAHAARSIASAETIAIVLSDPRLSGDTWQPATIVGRPELIEDTSGDHFGGPLLLQELRKYPPSRALADSPLLRREHWWYVLRLLVTVKPIAFSKPARRVGGAADAVLACFGDDIHVTAVAAPPSNGAVVPMAALNGQPLPGKGAAIMLQHDFSLPDRERDSRLVLCGDLDGDALTVTSRKGSIRLPGPPGLLARTRRQFQLSRDCRKALSSMG